MTKRSWILISLIIAFALFAFLVGGAVPYFLLYVSLLTLLLPLLLNVIALYSIVGSVYIPSSQYNKGDQILIEYNLSNKSFITLPNLEIVNSSALALSGKSNDPVFTVLKGRKAFQRRDKIGAARRGFYTVGVIQLYSRDIFGLFTLKRNIESDVSILVYPDIVEIDTYHITASRESGELIISDRMYQDRSRLSSLRDYREGDSFKAIHWKLSAVRDIPIVKEFENRGEANLIVFAENSRSVLSNDVNRRLEDLEVDIALSIISYCLDHAVDVSLHYQDQNDQFTISGSHITDIKPFMDVLARFSANGHSSLGSMILQGTIKIARGSNVIIITPVLDSMLGGKILELVYRGFKPSIIIASDYHNKSGHVDESVERKLRQEGISLIAVDCSSDTRKALEVGHG